MLMNWLYNVCEAVMKEDTLCIYGLGTTQTYERLDKFKKDCNVPDAKITHAKVQRFCKLYSVGYMHFKSQKALLLINDR